MIKPCTSASLEECHLSVVYRNLAKTRQLVEQIQNMLDKLRLLTEENQYEAEYKMTLYKEMKQAYES